MGKYLLLWELNMDKVPDDAKAQVAGTIFLLNKVKKDMKTGKTKDWGQFAGTSRGYSVVEGTDLEVASGALQYSPYVLFKVFPVLSVAQVGEVLKTMPGYTKKKK